MSSGQSLRIGSSVEPGLPNTRLMPNARKQAEGRVLDGEGGGGRFGRFAGRHRAAAPIRIFFGFRHFSVRRRKRSTCRWIASRSQAGEGGRPGCCGPAMSRPAPGRAPGALDPDRQFALIQGIGFLEADRRFQHESTENFLHFRIAVGGDASSASRSTIGCGVAFGNAQPVKPLTVKNFDVAPCSGRVLMSGIASTFFECTANTTPRLLCRTDCAAV